MAKFVPKKKMSKKAQKELAKKKRVTWDISPVTRKTENRKLYDRKRRSHDRYDDSGMGVFLPGLLISRRSPEPCGSGDF